jgi:hypothetical protein
MLKRDAVALELIAQEFMGSGLSFKTAKAALIADYKKSESKEEFLGKVVTYLEEIVGEPVTLTLGGE